MNNTIRGNTKDLLADLLVRRGVGEADAYEMAWGTADRAGLNDAHDDENGDANCVIVAVERGIPAVYHHPARITVVLVDFDIEEGPTIEVI